MKSVRTIAPPGRSTAAVTWAGWARTKLARSEEPPRRTVTEAGTRRKPSVVSSVKVRSAVELCPPSSTAVTEKRQRPSGAPVGAQGKRYVPGARTPLSSVCVTPPGPARDAVTVEGRTVLYVSVCFSPTPSPFGESSAASGGGT